MTPKPLLQLLCSEQKRGRLGSGVKGQVGAGPGLMGGAAEAFSDLTNRTNGCEGLGSGQNWEEGTEKYFHGVGAWETRLN